jgi:hypothetical protein
MAKEHKPGRGNSAHRVEISHLVHAYGITRDQARRLISRLGNNRAKLGEAARILKARLPSRSVSKAERPKKENPARALRARARHNSSCGCA